MHLSVSSVPGMSSCVIRKARGLRKGKGRQGEGGDAVSGIDVAAFHLHLDAHRRDGCAFITVYASLVCVGSLLRWFYCILNHHFP